MKLIPLSKCGKNRGKYFAMVDDEDFEWLNKWNWSYTKGYATNKTVGRMHRYILGLDKSNPLEGDHINGDVFDNQKQNLRIVNDKQQACNRKKWGKTGYIGVVSVNNICSYMNGKKRTYRHDIGFRAQIRINGKKTTLGGLCKTAEEAALRYNEAAKKYHGEFAKLNNVYEDSIIQKTLFK